MKFGIDFHDTIPWVYPLKVVHIEQTMPNWREPLAAWYAQKLIEKGLGKDYATHEAQEFAESLAAIPPQLLDRFYGAQIFGTDNYNKLTRHVHGARSLDAPLRPSVKEGLEKLASDDHEAHLVTIIRREHFPFVEKYLDKQGLRGMIAKYHRVEREENGGDESKVGYCLENGIYIHVDDELRRLKRPENLANGNPFLGILVSSGVNEEEAKKLIQDKEFVHLMENGGIDVQKFLRMVVEIEDDNLSAITKSNGAIPPDTGQHRIVYAKKFDPDVRYAINLHGPSYAKRM